MKNNILVGLLVGSMVQFYVILMRFVVNKAEDKYGQNNGLVVFLEE